MEMMGITESRHSRGFTLIELMIAVFVLALALGFGIPAFQDSIANSNLRGATMDLITAINTGRAEAVSQRKEIRLKPLGGDWNNGWLLDYGIADVATDDWDSNDAAQAEPLQRFEVSGTVTVTKIGNTDPVDFQGAGLVQDTSTNSISGVSFRVCDGRDDEIGRTITVNRFGKLDNTVHADSSTCNP